MKASKRRFTIVDLLFRLEKKFAYALNLSFGQLIDSISLINFVNIFRDCGNIIGIISIK